MAGNRKTIRQGLGCNVRKKSIRRRFVRIFCVSALGVVLLEGTALLWVIAEHDSEKQTQTILTGVEASASGGVKENLNADAAGGLEEGAAEGLGSDAAGGLAGGIGEGLDTDAAGGLAEAVRGGFDTNAAGGLDTDAAGGLPGAVGEGLDTDAAGGLAGAAGGGLDTDAAGGLDGDIRAGLNLEEYPEELQKLFELNTEAWDYVLGYPEREKYQGGPIDLTEDFVSGEVPQLMQWDRRWGYDMFGDSMIGIAGCGPVCMDMAYLYFTEDTDMTPRDIAEFAYEKGYYTEAGTSWSFWTEGAAKLGMKGKELPLDENRMKSSLDSGGLIVCSMRPGDFTTTGHYILIRGYGSEGFYVNDPNRRCNSEKVWSYKVLKDQIRNLWVLQKES